MDNQQFYIYLQWPDCNPPRFELIGIQYNEISAWRFKKRLISKNSGLIVKIESKPLT